MLANCDLWPWRELNGSGFPTAAADKNREIWPRGLQRFTGIAIKARPLPRGRRNACGNGGHDLIYKKINFDLYLNKRMRDPAFVERFERPGEAWDAALPKRLVRPCVSALCRSKNRLH